MEESKKRKAPNRVDHIDGDILAVNADAIAHQCNVTVTTGVARGLAKDLFARLPQANTYRHECKRTPGSIDVFLCAGTSLACKAVINMYAQRNKGKPNRTTDTVASRRNWFKFSLTGLAVAWPGAAGKTTWG